MVVDEYQLEACHSYTVLAIYAGVFANLFARLHSYDAPFVPCHLPGLNVVN